ncbi:hypothetical protein FCV25MIE_18769 [Fagus crenata]
MVLARGQAMLSGMKRSRVGRSKKGKRAAKESLVVPVDPSKKEGKKKAKVHEAPITSLLITSIDVLAMSKPISPFAVVTRGSARRTCNQTRLVIVLVGKDEKGSKDLPIDLSAGDKSSSGGKEIRNTLTKEGIHVNATAREFSALNECNINICELKGLADPARGGLIVEGGTVGIDLDIDMARDDGVETAGAQTELAPATRVETHDDSICDDVIIVLLHESPAMHDSLGIELLPVIESTKVVEPATIASRLAEELPRPFNSNDYFAGLGAFLDTIGLPMIMDKLIAHAVPTSEGVVDPNSLALIPHGGTPATVSGEGTSFDDFEGLRDNMLDQDAYDSYDDMDEDPAVRLSGKVVDSSSSSDKGIKVSHARGDDLDLTLRVSRFHIQNM